MNLIDIIVDGLIHRLDPVLHEYLPVEQLCAMNAGQLFNLFDQGQRFLMGNKFRGLDAIHEELELRFPSDTWMMSNPKSRRASISL